MTGPCNGQKAVLVLSDIFGFDGGRTKQYCDSLAARGNFLVVMPDMFNGDSAPSPTGPGGMDAMYAWIGNWPYSKISHTVDAALKVMKERGIQEIAVLGQCYGGYGSLHVSNNSSIPVRSAVTCHPSMQVAGFFNEDVLDLVRNR